jgi:hypothetical protein
LLTPLLSVTDDIYFILMDSDGLKTDLKREKNPHAVAMGHLGGIARSKRLTKERMREISLHAISVRWQNKRDNEELRITYSD